MALQIQSRVPNDRLHGTLLRGLSRSADINCMASARCPRENRPWGQEKKQGNQLKYGSPLGGKFVPRNSFGNSWRNVWLSQTGAGWPLISSR